MYFQAKRAFELGVNRLELCFDMANDGITPSFGTAKEIKENINIPVFCMIRPRGGNFVFDKNEINIMLKDIYILIKYAEIDGIVIGCLTKENEIDIETNKILINDINTQYKKNIDILINLGFDRILTKGCKYNSFQGKNNLKNYLEYAKDRIIIMPGKGITDKNYKELVSFTGCKEIHGTKIVGILE